MVVKAGVIRGINELRVRNRKILKVFIIKGVNKY